MERAEDEKYEEMQKQNKTIYSHTNKISEYEAQLNVSNRRLKDYEDKNSHLTIRVRELEDEIHKARA